MKHPKLLEILREFRKGVAEALGEELHAVMLYGSQARGDARGDDSDIDVLIVLRGPFRRSEVMEKTSELTARLCLEYDTLISRTFTTLANFEESRMPFYLNMRKEALPV